MSAPEKTGAKREKVGPGHPPKEFQFKPGNSGRPKGARNKLGEEFIKALHEDFQKHGPKAVETVRAEKPDQYLKVIASLLPKELNLNVNDAESMTDDEIIERLRNLNDAIGPLIAPDGIRNLNGGVDKTRAH